MPYTSGYGTGAAEKFASGNTPTRSDTYRMLLVKSIGTNVVSTSDASGSGTIVGQLWINKNTNHMWFWNGSSWAVLV